MKLELTEEQKMIQTVARDFAVREVEPRARELDKNGTWPTELVKRMGELGLMGVAIPMILLKLGRDPALGSSVLITACTDSGGFFIFLGLATLFLV